MTRRLAEKDSPVRYPKHWHDIILYPVQGGELKYNPENIHILARDLKPSQARTLKRRFAAFKACLKANPWHPTAAVFAGQTLWVRILSNTITGGSNVVIEKFNKGTSPTFE